MISPSTTHEKRGEAGGTLSLATARWGKEEELKKYAYQNGQFWLGRTANNENLPLGYNDDRHVCLVSGSRSGKGTTSIINNLCLWPGSVVVIDPKGENATITANRRGEGSEHCEGLGQKVHILDPFGVVDCDDNLRSRFNPLDAIDPKSDEAIDEAGRLADAIVVVRSNSSDPFWEESARSLIKGIILLVLTDENFEGRRNLITVRQLLMRGDWETVQLLEEAGDEMLASPFELLFELMRQNTHYGDVISGMGVTFGSMVESSPKTFDSVLQTANRNTEFLDSPGMRRCLEASDFRLSDLKTNPNGVSLFLSLPQRFMGTHYRWLRMMISLTITEMEKVRQQPACGHRVLLCLDEFAGLKKMEVIESAAAQIAGFGVKLFFVLQTLTQLKDAYKENWEVFVSNAGLKIFSHIEDEFTRKYVSSQIGETEVIRETQNSSIQTGEQSGSGLNLSQINTGPVGFISALIPNPNKGKQSSKSETRSESIHKSPLITPDEVGRQFARIDDKNNPAFPGRGLIFVPGEFPLSIRKVNYFSDPFFKGKFDPHPDHPISEQEPLPEFPEIIAAENTDQENPHKQTIWAQIKYIVEEWSIVTILAIIAFLVLLGIPIL